MAIPKKPVKASPEAVDAFITGGKTEAQTPQAETPAAQPQPSGAAVSHVLKPRKKPIRQKEIVTRCTFVINSQICDRLDAYSFWQRMTKKSVLEQALTHFFEGKKIRPIPRQTDEPELV